LALGGEIDHRNGDGSESGELDTTKNTAWRIRCSEEEFMNAIAEFQTRGWIEEIDDVLVLINYRRLQARPPSASREAVKQRVAKHRAHERNEPVTTTQRDVTSSDSDSDSDSDVDSDAEERATPPPNPPKRRRKRKTDPRTQHPAIQAVREVTNRYPSKPLWDEIISVVGGEPRLDDMRLCFKEWVKLGFNPTNFAWLFDWYVSGIPPRAVRRGSVQDQTAEAIRQFMEDDDG